MLRSSNPALNDSTFRDLSYTGDAATMTLEGTASKGVVLTGLLFGAAMWTWHLAQGMMQPGGNPNLVMGWAIGGAVVALIVGFVTVFAKSWSPYTTPVYAIGEGLFLGAISALFNARFPGIVFQAMSLTVLCLISLLVAYRSGLIRATENFKLGMVAVTGAIGLLYLVSMIMRMFGMTVPYIHDSGPIGIGFSVFVVIVAALNLVMDFDFIETGVERRAPKYMEWYAAFGLLVTLVWLYVEVLRLLAKLRSRD